MSAARMHPDEVPTSAELVARLLAAQYPRWADLPIRPVESAGTDNAIYRLGEDLAVRLPRIHWAVGQADKERTWLPRLALHLPLAIPVQVAMGSPAEGFPYTWSIYRWLKGENAAIARISDLNQAAADLAQFISALQQIDPANGPPAAETNLRGCPLARRDASTRQAIAALDGMYPAARLTVAWEMALQAPDWERDPVWFHGDLLSGNILVEEGRIRAVIDFSGLGVGDPACDLMIAWGLFSGESRAVFRSALQVDDATWARGRWHALSQALIFIPYYLETNPAGVASARRTVEAVLADL